MANSKYFETVIKRITENSVESTVSMLGITDPNLRKHLTSELKDTKQKKAFLADPVFESMFAWEKSDVRMSELAGNKLQPSLVKAMDEAGEHKFGKDWFPFKHQIKAWNTLSSADTKSVVVTSGTGSGKTECFMVPILNDLAKEYEMEGEALLGIRALFIYPLNALINSQRERLRAWTEAYDDGLRFCLYNGNTEENKHKDQAKYPNEILTRKSLRSTPPPMLVTNATMLEYMLVRQVDEPILEHSQGKLRWIVLDEAHTYIGSQAAELSLLLRRLLHAFGVNAMQVRFVATSATIGDGEADKQLQKYLAELAGVSSERVVVIGGKREIPALPSVSKNSISLEEVSMVEPSTIESSERYQMLSGNSISRKLRYALTTSQVPSTLSNLSKVLFSDRERVNDTLQWIDICSSTKDCKVNGSTPFLPVRAHLFHQVMSGLWCCADRNCDVKESTQLGKHWPFGTVFTSRRMNCDCGAPVYELVFCIDCNEPHLMANEKDGQIIQYERDTIDEFSLSFENDEGNVESEADETGFPETDSEKRYIAPVASELTNPISIERDSLLLTSVGIDTLDLNIVNEKKSQCACCGFEGYRSTFRQSFLGTPFYISNTAPTLLEACQESDNPLEKPARGRRLITFTDSRQGTARISTKIQQDSERDSIRGSVYGVAASIEAACDQDSLTEYKKKIVSYNEKINKFERLNDQDIVKDLKELRNGLLKEIASAQKTNPISWNELVNRLQTNPDISRWIFNYYNELNGELFPENGGTRVLTEMLLLREFARRPKRQNSLESLGLVSVQYPALSKVDSVPIEWKELNLTLLDWKDFLKLALDFYVRENTILSIPEDWVDWMGAKVYPKTVLNPDSEEAASSRIKKWPQHFGLRSNRLIRMIVTANNLDISDDVNKDRLNQILKAAWFDLTSKTKILKPKSGTLQYHLTTDEIAFIPCREVWICPVTHRLLDTTFKGVSPYLPFNTKLEKVVCHKVDISVCRVDTSSFKSELERKDYIRKWIRNEPSIKNLRSENLWTDICDKIVEGGKFFRTAEHSAQQPASKLKHYEKLFKSGRLNILSCSTTMEMGVDIGGISVVAMNNVPPHPANYLQRAGRAGRRGETQAISFTICKDNPHERSVFINPLWPFTTAIPAPYITLNSNRIVQRHVNSLLLSYFLKKNFSTDEKSFINLNCEWFFVATENENKTPYEKMMTWLNSSETHGMPEQVNNGVKLIVDGSVLFGNTIAQIIEVTANELSRVANKWLPLYSRLTLELESLGKISERDPYRRKLEHDIKRVAKDYLLSELASQSFLPGYGFPTGIATFDHYSIYNFKTNKYKKSNNKGRIDNMTRMRERPGRDMSVAIREYAPGADVVLDGLVYRSAGILLNKFAPEEKLIEPVKLSVEWRCHVCGDIGHTQGSLFTSQCESCESDLMQENIKEFITPEGFSVEFYSSPTTDISSQAYIPVQEPWVTAKSELKAIYNPLIGAFKNSAEGHIFHHSSGEHGTGYAVCLRCGRADSMTLSGEVPKCLEPGVAHKKLQGKPDKAETAHCEGSDEVYSIKANVHLGGYDQTDIFEIYLISPKTNKYFKHLKNDKLSWTLAVVLRQALADIHGINADEMGYTVKPCALSNVSYPVSGIALYDRAGGGAGFASSAPRHLKEMFKKARRILDCSENCESACQNCLMGYDTRFHINLLDRNLAIEFIDSIVNLLDMPKEAKVFGESTSFCLDGIDAELSYLSQKGFSHLRLYLGGNSDEWNISDSRLKLLCLNWLRYLKQLELVLPRLVFDELDETDKEDLWALSKLGISVNVIGEDKVNLPGEGYIIAQLNSDTQTCTFGCDNKEAMSPNVNYWNFKDSYQLMSYKVPSLSVQKFDINRLRPDVKQGDVEVEIRGQLDGYANGFGQKLWKLIAESHDELRNRLAKGFPIKRICYSDIYISSQISFLLFSEMIDGLKQFTYDWNNPSIELNTGLRDIKSSAQGVYSEWKSSFVQKEVFEYFFEELMSERLVVNLIPPKELPHGRIFEIIWQDNCQTTLRFDHGVGAWSKKGSILQRLNENDSTEKQVNSLAEILNVLQIYQKSEYSSPVFIKHRDKS